MVAIGEAPLEKFPIRKTRPLEAGESVEMVCARLPQVVEVSRFEFKATSVAIKHSQSFIK